VGVDGNMKTVIVRGPVFSKSGYGEHVRCIIRALIEREDLFDVYILPTVWGNTGWRYNDTDENKKFFHLAQKTNQFRGKYDISLQVSIPHEWANMAEFNIGVTAAVETTAAGDKWIQYCNFMHHLIVVSQHAKDSLIKPVYKKMINDKEEVTIRCETDIDVIGYPTKEHKSLDLPLELTTKFNFLTIAQDSPRKNMSATVRSFINEFKNEKDVGLILKLNKMNDSLLDRSNTKNQIQKWIQAEAPDGIECKIYLLHGPLTEQEIHSLYTHKNIHSYITTTHGEGYGLPIFEAAYSGLPILAPAWSGHTDFLYMPEENQVSKKVKKVPMFSKIRYELNPVQEEAHWEDIIIKESKWCFVDLKACQKMMRHMYKTHDVQKKRALRLQKYLLKEYSQEKIHEKIVTSITKHFGEEEFSLDSWLEKMESDLEINE